MGRLHRVCGNHFLLKAFVVVATIALSACAQKTETEAGKSKWRAGCGPEVSQLAWPDKLREDARLVADPEISPRPAVDVSYTCLMKAVAQPTPEMLNDLVARAAAKPGAWSRDFYQLNVSAGTLEAVFWPRNCVKFPSLSARQWTAIFMDNFRVPGPPRMRTAVASFPGGSESVGDCIHAIRITPGVNADAKILSGKGLNEVALGRLFRMMIQDPTGESMTEYVNKRAMRADKYKLGWQMIGNESYVLTFDTDGPCVPIGLFNGITPDWDSEKYMQVRANVVPRPDDPRCISSVQTMWIKRWRG